MPERASGSPWERAVHEGLTGRAVVTSSVVLKNQWVEPFLEKLAVGKSVIDACAEMGLHPSFVYRQRKNDPVFAAAWRECVILGTELLEAEACRRGYHGVDRPVFYKGEVCGHVREYSDALLTTVLKSRDARYRDGPDDSRGPMTLNVNIVTVETREEAQAAQVVDGLSLKESEPEEA